jgi:hypothetical protein
MTFCRQIFLKFLLHRKKGSEVGLKGEDSGKARERNSLVWGIAH